MTNMLAEVAAKQNATAKSDAPRRTSSRKSAPVATTATDAIVPAGLDAGNSCAVVSFGITADDVVTMPSCVHAIPKPDSGELLSCPPKTFQDGSGTTLEMGSTVFYVGQSAIDAGGSLATWTGSASNVNKPKFSPLFLISGAVSRFPHARHIKLFIYAGMHQASIEPAMRQALSGSHHAFILNTTESGDQTRREVVVEVQVSKILYEDQGALFNASHISPDGGTTYLVPRNKKVAVIGIGGGTTNVSVYEGANPIRVPVPSEIGGLKLIREICQHPSLTKMLSRAGYHDIGGAPFDLVKAGIENGTMMIGETGISFKSVYELLVEPYLISPVISHASSWFKPSDVAAILVTGGGAKMPVVVDNLRHHFPKVVTTNMGHIDTPIGFYRLAQRALAKLGK
jgi:hypothetical protein